MDIISLGQLKKVNAKIDESLNGITNQAYPCITGSTPYTITGTGSSAVTLASLGKYNNSLSLKAGKTYALFFRLSLRQDNVSTAWGVSGVLKNVSDNSNITASSSTAVSYASMTSNTSYVGYTLTTPSVDTTAFIYLYITSLANGAVMSVNLESIGFFEVTNGHDYTYYLNLFKSNNFKQAYSGMPDLSTRIAALESVQNPNSTITAWGDSLTMGNEDGTGVTYPGVLSTLVGKSVNNFGVGGEKSATIMGRQGAMPMIVQPGFTIPADNTTPVTVTLQSHNMDPVAPLRQIPTRAVGLNPVSINGIQGTLAYDTTNLVYTFTRTTAGTATAITRPFPLITDGMINHRNDGILLLWIGTNDIPVDTSLINDDFYYQMISYYKLMLEYAGCKKFLIIGFIEGNYSKWQAFHYRMYNVFGRHYIDIHQYLVNYGLQDAGLTPTAQDTTDISNVRVPTSLRYDGLHLNQYGYTVLGQRVYQRGKELGYW